MLRNTLLILFGLNAAIVYSQNSNNSKDEATCIQDFENGNFSNIKKIIESKILKSNTIEFIQKSISILEDTNTNNYINKDGEESKRCINLNLANTFDAVENDFEFTWEFADGTLYNGYEVTHCFADTGFKKIKLNFKDNSNNMIIESDTVITVYIPDNDLFIEHDKQIVLNKSFNFKLENKKLKKLKIFWDMGDGHYKLNNENIFTYKELGNYTIKCYVENLEAPNESISVYSKKITVKSSYLRGPTINSTIDEYNSPKK